MQRLLFVLFYLPLLVMAQPDISGSVLDDSGAPLPGATVLIKGTQAGAVTDIDGEFFFQQIKPGDYQLVITSVGFEPKEVNVSHGPNSPSTLNVKLAGNITELEEMVVVSDRDILEKRTSGYNVNILSVDQYHDLNMDVNQILGTMSGVNIREKGGLGSGFELSLNGLSGNQVRYFIDEVPMEFYGSALTLNNFPSNLVQSLEVYKGVTPVELTSDALGGAINMKTYNPQEHLLDVSYSIGSFNTHRASVFAQTSSQNNLYFRVMSFFNHSDNNYKMKKVPYADEFGNIRGYQSVRRFHDAYTSGSVGGVIGLVDQKFADELTLGFTYAGNKNEIQHTNVSINRVYGGLSSENETYMANFKHSKSWDKLEWKTNAVVGQVYETYYDTLMQRFDWQGNSREIQTAEIYSSPSIRELKDEYIWARSSMNYAISTRHRLVGQFSMNYLKRSGRDKINPLLNGQFNPNHLNKNFAGLSYDYQSKNDRVKTSVFAKQYWYNAEIYTEEYVGDGTEVVRTSSGLSRSGYGATLSYLINSNWLVKGSYEFAYRLPEAYEIMGNGLLVLPSPDLKPESSHNVNLGILSDHTLPIGNLKTEWNAFYRPTRDKIWPVAQGVLSTYQNIQNTRIIGVESANSLNIDNKYMLTFNLTYQSNTDQREFNEGIPNSSYGDRMPNDPFFFGDLGVQYRLQVGETMITAMWNSRYVQEFFLYAEGNGDAANKRSIPSQFINNLNINCNFAEGRYNASVSVNNIFDAEAYDNWSLQKPGRAFYLKLRYFFNKL